MIVTWQSKNPIVEASMVSTFNHTILEDFIMDISCVLRKTHSTCLSMADPHFFASHAIFLLHITAHCIDMSCLHSGNISPPCSECSGGVPFLSLLPFLLCLGSMHQDSNLTSTCHSVHQFWTWSNLSSSHLHQMS